MRPGELKLRLLRDREIAFGPGKADLLEAIRDTGSIAAAARRLAMSYPRAWSLVDTMNRCFREPLVEAGHGGTGGGGAALTTLGAKVLETYRKAEAAAARAAAPGLSALRRRLKRD